ncbi:RNA polymerase factor sigma-54 [Miniphocaeibacter massiliensis]|uniref:RNA polymerase factor sigma-54 n=1 Tax=Miniphocaeibacter massiliensis TaxID=2041841 RepID=UPI000C07B857|nr:RNA polymerase factor sigma-54 [Miniphocaeibacter massiliensis]
MKNSMDIQLKQKLDINMTLNLQQSIKLLEMNSLELKDYISKTIIENPLIELKEKNIELNIEKYLDKNVNYNKGFNGDFEKFFIEDNNESLYEHINKQLGILYIDKTIKKNILILVDNLDSNGYLDTNLEHISKIYNIDIKSLRIALDILNKLDPVGIGGKDLIETLLLQVENDNVLKKIIINHIDDIYKKNYKKIIKELGITENLLKIKINKLKSLNPRPALPYNMTNTTNFIIPDARVEVNEDVVEIIINDELIPDIVLSKFYEDYVQNRDEETKKYVKKMKRQFDWLKNSLSIRKNTLYKVIDKIVKEQYDFFRYGEKYLLPIKQKNLANDLNVSESTVSRIVNNKYIETSKGVLPLKYFFYSGPSDLVSDKVIMNLIKEFIEKENKKKPLSDSKLSNLLEEKGIKIARRTVTKYREKLQIENSTRRKEFS